MTTEYAARKNEECYDHVFILHHPDEEREACRPLRTAPAYDRQKALGAQFGQVNGWERPNYYGPTTRPPISTTHARSFRRGDWWQYAKAEAEGDPQDRRPDRRHRLHQAPRARAGRDGLPRLASPCNKLPERGPDQPDLRADRPRARRAPNTPSSGWTRTNTTSSPPGPGRPMTLTILRKCAED